MTKFLDGPEHRISLAIDIIPCWLVHFRFVVNFAGLNPLFGVRHVSYLCFDNLY